MADGYDEDDEVGLLKLADDAIVAQAIAPQTELAVAKRLAKGARVLRLADAFFHEVENFALNLMIEFLEVLDGALIVLNRPSRAASGPGQWSSVCRDFRGELRRGNGPQGLRCFPRCVWWRRRSWCGRFGVLDARGGVAGRVSSGWKAFLSP